MAYVGKTSMLRTAFVTVLLGGGVGLQVSDAQPALRSRPVLPSEVKLAEVEIRLAYETHGGCIGRCIAYNVLIRGDGVVRYVDVGGEPREPIRTRTMPIDEVVDLVNDVLNAHFFEAAANYSNQSIAVRDDDSLRFMTRGGIDGPESSMQVDGA